jgi:hypothetical protein
MCSMKRTGKAKRINKGACPFACPIGKHTDLGLAMLIVEDDAGSYEPVGVVATLSEAYEIAADDFGRRLEERDRGGDPMVPVLYKVFARGTNGDYHEAGRFSL